MRSAHMYVHLRNYVHVIYATRCIYACRMCVQFSIVVLITACTYEAGKV